ncbi:GNAT family N-acetyltransferase [Methyloglobulus sp.]|uniref:GNAT family N-acetyltransferase n=1 Tax=Methyloglobulus sp. TaxID=2518622 RepID=UPI0032B850DD
MRVHELKSAPDTELSRALKRFEQQFAYPLGIGRCFHIQHHTDYPRFFRAIGDDAMCFVAESGARVIGVISVAHRKILMPNGEIKQTAYIGDLKIDPASNRGRILIKLAQAAERWVKKRGTTAFGVVMDGTSAIPPQYTGRLGIPLFQEIAKIKVLQVTLPAPTANTQNLIKHQSDVEIASVCLGRLSLGSYACIGGDSDLRSDMETMWLTASNEQACAMLEDTRKAKRLITNDGNEMCNAHLSYFAFKDLRSGVELLKVACHLATKTRHSGLFVAIAESDANHFLQELKDWNIIVAPATVFGIGFEKKFSWVINTAEI